MDKKELAATLSGLKIPAFRFFPTIGSTNDVAKQWLSDAAPEYAIVIADQQTSGRGRQGRTWVTTSGASIALSIILYPTKKELTRIGLFSLAAGLAVTQTISAFCDGMVQVKWPNDVLIDNKKVAGILTESVWKNDQLSGMVIGIGINVYKQAVPPDSALRFPATCMQDHSKIKLARIKIITRLIESILVFRPLIKKDNFSQRYEQQMAFLHQNITLHRTESKKISGKLTGIDTGGNLLLRMEDDQIRAFPVGDISLRLI